MVERGNDDFVVVRLLIMDEKMEGVDLSVDDGRLERDVERIDERSRARHEVLRLCCIVNIYVKLLLGAQWPVMARGPGAIVAVEGSQLELIADCGTFSRGSNRSTNQRR